MKTSVQVVILTVGAVLIFAGLRHLPDAECGFLHYQSPQVNADGIEFCGDDAPTFLDLERLRFPVTMDVVVEPPVLEGEESYFRLQFTSSSGRVIQPHELAITHTQPLHVMLVDPTLEDYHHIHPEPLGASGQWGFAFTPARSGTYRMFAEFVPARTRQKIIIMEGFEVQPAAAEHQAVPVQPPGAFPAELLASPAVLSSRVENSLTLRFAGDVELQPVMGALGHMVAFDERLTGFAHLHPKYTGRETGGNPELSFAFNTDRPGNYRLWAQVKIDGKERFYPFDLVVN